MLEKATKTLRSREVSENSVGIDYELRNGKDKSEGIIQSKQISNLVRKI